MTTTADTVNVSVKKICLVCGDKALGYNFNAITCESCKAFFRRNAVKQKQFKCPFRDQCVITIASRRFCQKCRLRKCFEVGMMKELITIARVDGVGKDAIKIKCGKRRRRRCKADNGDSGNEKQSKALTVIGNETKQELECWPSDLSPVTCVDEPYKIQSSPTESLSGGSHDYMPLSSGYQPDEIACQLATVQPDSSYCQPLLNSHQQLCHSPYSPQMSLANEKLMDLGFGSCFNSNFDDWTGNVKILIEFPSTFSAHKLFRLEELLSANEIMAAPNKALSGPPISFADQTMLWPMMDICVRRTVQVARRIKAFRSLSPADQVALLQGASMQLVILRGVMVYQPHVESWRPIGFPHRYLRLDVMRWKDGYLDRIKKLYNTFEKDWRYSEPIMLSLFSMILFDPRCPNVTDRRAVAVQQEFYRDLLKEYLKSIYDASRAEDAFWKLVGIAEAVRQNADVYVTRFALDIDPFDMETVSVSCLDNIPY